MTMRSHVPMIDLWPIVARAMRPPISPGDIVATRTRRGIRRLRVRVVRSAERVGRRYLIGDSRRGWCHIVWLDDVIQDQL